MNPVIAVVFQVISFLVSHKDQLKQMVLDIESLLGDAPGATKAGAVKTFIGAALGVEDKIEQAWPMVAPLFNGFVARIKAPAAAAA